MSEEIARRLNESDLSGQVLRENPCAAGPRFDCTMHQRVAMECRVHAQYVPHELVVRLVVDDVVVGDDKCVRCERSNHRNFGEADEDHGADYLRN